MTRHIATIGILSHSFLLKWPFYDKQRGVAEESPNDSDLIRIAHIEGRALACETQQSGLTRVRKKVRRELVPFVGIELTTYRLQGGCSTTELKRHISILLDDFEVADFALGNGSHFFSGVSRFGRC